MTCTTSTFSLLFLPLELLEEIGPHLDKRSVANARLACIPLYQVFTRYLVDSLTLKVSSNLEFTATSLSPRARPVFHSFVPTPPSLVAFIRDLTVDFGEVFSGTTGEIYYPEAVVEDVQTEVARFASLKKLKLAVDHLMGRPTPGNITEVVKAILLAASGARLIRLKIDEIFHLLAIPTSPPAFDQFRHLKDVHFSVRWFRGAIDGLTPRVKISCLAQQIQTAIVRNPTLASLAVFVETHPDYTTKFPIDLQGLFPSRASTPCLSLHTIRLSGKFFWPTDFDFTSFPHLPKLRRLSLVRCVPSTEWSGFWDFLRLEGAQLEYLETDLDVTPSLVQYLSSYRGMEELVLHRDVADVDVAHSIIHSALPLHAPTLRKLGTCVPGLFMELGVANTDTSIAHWPLPDRFPLLTHLYVKSPRGWKYPASAHDLVDWAIQFPALCQVLTLWKVERGLSPENRIRIEDVDQKFGKRTRKVVEWQFEGSLSGPDHLPWNFYWIKPNDDYRTSSHSAIQPPLIISNWFWYEH